MRVAVFLLLQCSVTALAGEARADWSTRTIGGTEVHLYVPSSGGTIGDGRGLLVALHGCTQQNDALKDRGNFAPAAEQYGLVIALPQVPNGGVIAGCWDYYGADHARTGRHDGFLLSLVEELLGDASLAIDERQVYVAGLSSGAGQAAIIGCLAPDVFAGVGINAGPAPGTTVSQFSVVSSTAQEASMVCDELAGSAGGAFSTQLAAVIAGTSDFVVAQGYARVLAEMYAHLYSGTGPALQESAMDVAALDGYEPAGTGSWFSDGVGRRVSLISAQGMGHAFPAGSGPGPEISFVASEGVDWPIHLAELFTTNNRRVGQVIVPPEDAGGSVNTDAGGDGGSPRDAGNRDSGGGADAGVARADGGSASVSDDSESGCGCTSSRGSAASPWIVLALMIIRLSFRSRNSSVVRSGDPAHR